MGALEELTGNTEDTVTTNVGDAGALDTILENENEGVVDFASMSTIRLLATYKGLVGIKIKGFAQMSKDEKVSSLQEVLSKAAEPAEVENDVEDDLLKKTNQEIELLDEKAAKITLVSLEESTGFEYFRMGGVLALIQSNGWFGEHLNFKEWVDAETSIGYRKAVYLTAIYNGLLDTCVPWEMVKSVGWTKLKELIPVLTPDNAGGWVEQANNASTIQLIELVKAHLANEDKPEGFTGDEPKKVSTMTFKLHDDQKETIEAALETVKAELGSDYPAVALEHMCINYLGNPQGGKLSGPQFQVAMTALGIEKTLDVFALVFPDVSLTVEVPSSDS